MEEFQNDIVPKNSKWWKNYIYLYCLVLNVALDPLKLNQSIKSLFKDPIASPLYSSVKRNIFECGNIHYIHGSLKDCGAVEIPEALRFRAAILKWMIILFDLWFHTINTLHLLYFESD